MVNTEERDNLIFRKVRGILNKLTPEKFDKLSLELLNIGIDSKHILKGIILLIFDKALDEPKYSKLYAQLCHRLCEDAPNFEAPSSKITSFKRLLLNKCQDEFENRSRAFEAFDKDELTPDEEEQFAIAKHKMLGNIKFIGELGKLDMLHEGILHRCIQQLLEKKTKAQSVQDMGEDFECLCQIMKTVGKALDHDKARLWMDQYFDRIRTIMSHPDLPPRIKFMLLDIVELRENQWIPRKNSMDTGPKTIQQVREEAFREYGYAAPPTAAMASLAMNMDPFGRPMNGTIPHKSMMGDIFGPVSPPYMGSSSLGTGPGVVDDFTPSFLAGNPGRQSYDVGFQSPYSNRGRQNEKRGGHSSPRFNRYNNAKGYHREKEADNDSDDDYNPRDRQSGRDSHFSYPDRYNSSRDVDRQQPSRYNNRSQQNSVPSMNYRNNENHGYQPTYPLRQRSPYGRDGPEEGSRDSGTPESDSWRKEKMENDQKDERLREKRAYRPGIDDVDLVPACTKRDNRIHRDDWDREQPEKDHIIEKDVKPYREPVKRDAGNLDGREDAERSVTRDDHYDYDKYGHEQQHPKKNHDWDYQKSWRNVDKDRDDSQDRRIYQNGDIRDHHRDMEPDHSRDYRPSRDFIRDKDYGGGSREFHDGRDLRDGRDFRDGRGFGRDFDGRSGGGGFDRDRPGYQYHRGGSSGPQPQRDGQPPRELPPRFQRKQQQQQHQQQQGPVDLFTNDIPMAATDNGMPVVTHSPPPPVPPGAPPQRYRPPVHPGQRPPMPGYFPPRYPPPGGPPVRGPLPRGYPPGQLPPGMPRYPMGPNQGFDSPRDGMPSQIGGPGQASQNLPKGPAKPDEISLRPARNFPTVLRPSAPSMLPKSAQNPCLGPSHVQPMPGVGDILGPGPGGPQPMMRPTNLTIKQVSSSDRKDKRKLPNKEQLKHTTEELIKKFVESGNVEEAINTVKDMKPPRRFMPEMISMLIIYGLERADDDRENISKLILSMKEEGVLASDLYMDGLCKVLECMSELEQEIPLVKSNVAKFAAQAVGSGIITLADLAEPLQNGSHYPFFLLCLQQLHKVKDKEWLVKAFNESKIELLTMLPECDRTKERMVEILEDRSLSFMFPLLRVQSDLWRQIRSDPNPANIYKWIKENVDSNLQSDPGFIEILVTNVLKYITSETTLKPDTDHNNPDKAAIDKEKEMLEKYKGVLQRFLLDKINLQMVAIYAIQVLGYNRQFPKGLMLRMFINMYNLEIIDEETFLKWKEEVNDEYPGKGQVLFQVNQWLTWLELAEEEESEEEDN